MTRRSWARLFVVSTLLCIATRSFASDVLVRFGGTHTVLRSRAVLDASLVNELDARLGAAKVTNVDDALSFSLEFTAEHLFFGLHHRTDLRFREGAREGHCIEYANLFAAVFSRVAAKKQLPAEAFAVHSSEARVLSQKLPWRGLADHDWALVVVRDKGVSQQRQVDPTFYDLGLSWDIASSVVDPVCLPAR